jgi:spermidine synthase
MVGTLVTSFVLIPTLPIRHILVGTGASLIVLGAAIFARRGRGRAALALVVPVLGLLNSNPRLPEGFVLMDGAHGAYGTVQIIDTQDGVRLMRADHSVVGAQAKVDGSSAFAFLHMLEALHIARPQAKDLLQIGLGVGSLPMALQRFGVKSDVVEIDPKVVQFAQQYFGFKTKGEIIVEDARTFLRRTDRKYDLIVHDTFTGGATPEHLLSVEVLQRLRSVLRPGGILALNFVGYSEGPGAEASHAVARTMRVVFPMLRVFRDSPPDHRPTSTTNLVFFATDSTLDFRVPEGATFENHICENVQRSFAKWEVLKQIPAGSVITDARNPLARLQLTSAEEHFEAMRKLLPKEIWLNQ